MLWNNPPPRQEDLLCCIQIGVFHAGVPVGGPSLNQVLVRCSDPNVICESRKVHQGEPHDVFLKVRLSLSFRRYDTRIQFVMHHGKLGRLLPVDRPVGTKAERSKALLWCNCSSSKQNNSASKISSNRSRAKQLFPLTSGTTMFDFLHRSLVVLQPQRRGSSLQFIRTSICPDQSRSGSFTCMLYSVSTWLASKDRHQDSLSF